MKTRNVILFFSGLFLLLIVIIDLYWWIDVSSDTSKSFEEVKAEYFKKFPSLLATGLRITIFNLVLLSFASFLFIKSATEERLKILSGLGLIISVILGAWMIFTLM